MRIKLILFFVFISCCCFAQSSFGISGGMNFTGAYTKIDYSLYHPIDQSDPVLISEKANMSTYSFKPTAGLYYYAEITPRMGIQTDALYNVVRISSETSARYVMVPVKFGYRVKRFTFLAGNYVGFLLKKEDGLATFSYGVSVGVKARTIQNLTATFNTNIELGNMYQSGTPYSGGALNLQLLLSYPVFSWSRGSVKK